MPTLLPIKLLTSSNQRFQNINDSAFSWCSHYSNNTKSNSTYIENKLVCLRRHESISSHCIRKPCHRHPSTTITTKCGNPNWEPTTPWILWKPTRTTSTNNCKSYDSFPQIEIVPTAMWSQGKDHVGFGESWRILVHHLWFSSSEFGNSHLQTKGMYGNVLVGPRWIGKHEDHWWCTSCQNLWQWDPERFDTQFQSHEMAGIPHRQVSTQKVCSNKQLLDIHNNNKTIHEFQCPSTSWISRKSYHCRQPRRFDQHWASGTRLLFQFWNKEIVFLIEYYSKAYQNEQGCWFARAQWRLGKRSHHQSTNVMDKEVGSFQQHLLCWVWSIKARSRRAQYTYHCNIKYYITVDDTKIEGEMAPLDWNNRKPYPSW